MNEMIFKTEEQFLLITSILFKININENIFLYLHM